jgi:NhaP-type Na+/H+ or K+/H+ antiporter
VLLVTVTVVVTYLCFYLAEFTFLKVSGILSILSLGLYLSAVGRRKIYLESENALHDVWSFIQYSCETLIFIITGIVIGTLVITDITVWDWVRMFVFWFLMIGVRAVMILTFYPVLRQTGYGITKKELVVLVYGGLRGALGMCLALMVGVDRSLPSRFRELTMFYMCGMAVLTVLVNGLTCRRVVNYV